MPALTQMSPEGHRQPLHALLLPTPHVAHCVGEAQPGPGTEPWTLCGVSAALCPLAGLSLWESWLWKSSRADPKCLSMADTMQTAPPSPEHGNLTDTKQEGHSHLNFFGTQEWLTCSCGRFGSVEKHRHEPLWRLWSSGQREGHRTCLKTWVRCLKAALGAQKKHGGSKTDTSPIPYPHTHFTQPWHHASRGQGDGAEAGGPASGGCDSSHAAAASSSRSGMKLPSYF